LRQGTTLSKTETGTTDGCKQLIIKAKKKVQSLEKLLALNPPPVVVKQKRQKSKTDDSD